MKSLFESITESLDPSKQFGAEATNIPEIKVK